MSLTHAASMSRIGGGDPIVVPNFEFFTNFSGGLSPNSLTERHVEPPNPAGVVSWQEPDANRFVQTAVVPPGTSHALAFVFPAKPPGGDTIVEQNMLLGQMIGGAGRHFGLELDVLFGANYELREVGSPDKFCQFWEKEYSNTCTVGITLVGLADGSAEFSPFITGFNPGTGSYSLQPAPSQTYHQPYGNRFVKKIGTSDAAITPGVWARVRHLVKFSTSPVAADGWVKTWVDGALFMSTGLCNIWSYDIAGPNPPIRSPKIGRGYLMGYSNNGHDEETRFYWANLRIVDFDPGWG